MKKRRERAPLHVQRAQRPRTKSTRAAYAAFRVMLYGIVGLASEIIFYNLVRIGRQVPVLELFFRFEWRVDPSLNLDHIWDTPVRALYGQCSLWMFAVYAVAAFGFIEPLYRRLAARPVLLRAAVYGVTILVFEGVSGLLLEAMTGLKIWYYADALAIIGGMTSLYILPVWMVTGLLVELIYRELMDPDVAHGIETQLAQGGLPDPALEP